ncbi:BatD family protein [Porphyromonas macacae]|uniref:BatD family protein n=1 Tax=Porphyromonas macacae TaxID=28115 RepID=UPI0035A04DF2
MIKNSYKKIFAIIFSLLPVVGFAQSFKVNAPQSVAMGERFQIVFSLEDASGSDFRAPSMSDFDVLYGPAVTSSSMVQYNNGKRSKSQSTSYTYTLIPKKEGTFEVGSASIRSQGKQLTTQAFKIKVLPPNTPSQGTGGSSNQTNGTGQISSNSIFYRTIVNKTKVYEQEAIAVTFKLYIDPNIGVQQLEDLKMPEFNGFISQTVEDGNEAQLVLENYNGRNYRTAVIQRMILFPQRNGRLQLPAGMIQVALALPPEPDEDPFFARPIIVSRKIYSQPVNIDVTPLPAEDKPGSFNGAVGQFSMKVNLSSQKPKTNESMTVTVDITGEGNLKLLSSPELKFPDTFEVYDPKVENKMEVTAGGVRGSRTIEYYAVPRQTGEYTLPEFEFSFFDPVSKSYKTLKSRSVSLSVSKGKDGVSMVSSTANKEDIKLLSQDISYLKKETGVKRLVGYDFTFGLFHWLLYVIGILIAAIVFVPLKRMTRLQSNETALKHRRANNVAKRRFREANTFRLAGDKESFNTALLRALWGFLGDKFKMSLSELNRSNIEIVLSRKGATSELIEDILKVIDQAEYEKYAPSSDLSAMDKLYADAEKIIERIVNAKLN